MNTQKLRCLTTLKELETELKKLISLGWKILSVSQISTGYIVTAERPGEEEAA